MNRRDFLSLCGLAAGSCIIPVRLARSIRDTCVLGGQPYFINAPATGSVLYAAQNTFNEFTFRLGEEVSPPTWREYLEESQGVDPGDPEAVKVWQREQLCCEPGEEEEIAFDEQIDGWALDNWLEWDYSLRDGPEAQAYRYLEDLPLDDGKKTGGTQLGDLRFIEGDRPGSNFTYVEAPTTQPSPASSTGSMSSAKTSASKSKKKADFSSNPPFTIPNFKLFSNHAPRQRTPHHHFPRLESSAALRHSLEALPGPAK